jgi:hypothetical protein
LIPGSGHAATARLARSAEFLAGDFRRDGECKRVEAIAFVIGNLVWIFTPANISLLLLPQIIALLSLGLWLLVRAVDTEKWNQAAVASSQL